MRSRNREAQAEVITPVPQPATTAATTAEAEAMRARVRSLLDLGDDLIERALSSDSQTYLAQNRQQGGQ